MPRFHASFPLLLALLALSACARPVRRPRLPDAGPDDATVDAATDRATGAACDQDEQCASELCLQVQRDVPGGLCSGACEADDECPDTMGCGLSPEGDRVCVPRACGEGATTDLYVCREDQSVACEQVDRTMYCDTCGCGDSNLRCVENACMRLAMEGEDCRRDSDCNTLNCSALEGICRAPLGGECTTTNCDLCVVHDDPSWSYCSRGCDSDSDCRGGRCVASASGERSCRPTCTASCPTACSAVGRSDAGIADAGASDGGALDAGAPVVDAGSAEVCACPTCEEQPALMRRLYSLCDEDAQCTSGACFAHSMCTVECTADAECGDTGGCVNVCGGTSGAGCNVCLHRCEADGCDEGTCRATPPASGGDAIMVCDLRRPEGGACQEGRDCDSGRCLRGACIPLAGLRNGVACSAASDCASTSCINGKCRGRTLLGDECTTSDDCAVVGSCCDEVCRASC